MWKKILLIFIFIFLASPVWGQYYFGKNKIQYTQFDWRVMETDHFRVYFYSEEGKVAGIAARIAEESYQDLESKFNYALLHKVPLILYSTKNYFQQTNVIPLLLPEAVEAFMERIKGRVVVPFEGSYSRLRHSIKHELVHSFTFEKLDRVLRDHRKYNFRSPPLWFTEGIAEYWSVGWDEEADMVMRDAVISGKFVPLSQMAEIEGTYLMYKEGQSFLRFISQRYGEEKLWLLFENCWRANDLNGDFQLTIGKDLQALDKEWSRWLKKSYFPQMRESDFPEQVATRLTSQGINVKPVAFSPDSGGQEVIFKSSRMGYANIYSIPSQGEGKGIRLLVKGERAEEFESLHLLRERMSVSREGKLAFVAKRNEGDVLYLLDLKKGVVERWLNLPGLVFLSSPDWSPDSKRIVIVGADKSGFHDLYIVDVGRGRLQRLTQDIYDEREPSWSPLGDEICFSSDRHPGGKNGYYNLFSYDLKNGRITPLTWGSYHDYSPSFSPDGREIAFSSDRGGGIFNIYLLEGRRIKRVTDLFTGAFDPCWGSKGGTLFFSGYGEYGYQIYRKGLGDTVVVGISSPQEGEPWRPLSLKGEAVGASIRYRQKFSLDLAQSAMAYNIQRGAIGGVQAVVTDVLGNHQYYFLLGNTARTKANFLSSFNMGVWSLNLEHRFNYGWGLFHLFDEYFNDYEGWYTEREYGGVASLSYPLTKFQRAEANLLLRQSDKEVWWMEKPRRAFLSTIYLSLIKDTSLWGRVGPIDGLRLNLSFALTAAPSALKLYDRYLSADLRSYLRLSRRSCWAFRIVGKTSQGKEPQRFYMGGSWSMRGYQRRSFMGRNLLLINNELRFPLLERFLLASPVMDLDFRGIRGAIFFDLGNAWEESWEGLKGSFGVGFRVGLGYYTALRFDWSKTTDFHSLDRGVKFNFFFGWDY